DTTGRPEGELTLRATAVDEDGNVATADRVVVVDNLDGGSVSGVVFKGPVGGATVKIYRFPDGVKGDLLGEGVTADDGGFTNIVLGNGYSGPLLIEAGGAGTYGEEAAPATTVTFDVTDQLRTVVPVYTDGDAVSGRAVTPLTSFVVTYYEFLRTQQTGTFAEVWGAARTTMQEHFGVPDLLGLQPLRPAQMTTFSSPAKYGLVLVGLSRMAWQASNQGGGDGGSFGTSMNALRVWKVLDQDLADGCWNGMAGSTPLVFGGTQSVADDSARKRLADAIVAYLGSAQNQTPFDGAADILPLLDTLSLAGPAAGDGTTCAAGELFPTPGDTYDQTPPVMTFEAPTPGADAYVRQSITVAALATDDLDLRPATVFTAPADLADLDADGDGTDRDATITIDTASRPDGPLTITATGTDDSGNVGTGTRTFTIDNTQPVIAIDGVTADGYYPGAVTLSFSQTEANPGTLTATLDGAAFASGQSVFGEGAHTLVVTAIDLAGNTATLTRAFTIDTTAPVVTINGVTQGAYYNSSRTITYALTDTNGGTVTATLDGASFTSGGAVSAEGVHTLRVTATDLSGNETVVTRTFTIDTTAPVIAISGVDANGFYDASVTITFTQTETNPSTLTAKLDGNPFASGQSVLASGAHTLIVTALDLAGNTASLTRTFTIDTAAPQITIVGVTQGAYYNNNRTITFSQTDANPGALTAELDGSAFASGASVGAEGVHTLVVTATDLAGNQASASRTFTIDKTAPVITVNGVTPNGFYGASVTITFSQADTNPDTLTATLDAAAFTSGQSVFSEGAHTLVVTATDRAGNTSTVNRTFTVDTTAPVVTINGVTQGAYYNVGKTITFTQADANPDALSATLDGLPFVSGSTVSVEGPHTVTVTAVDRAGNQTVASRSFTIDTISPVLSIGGIAANGYYNQSVTITYAQNDANPGTLSAKLDGGAFASGQSVFGEGAHTLVVTATDLAGNTSTLSRSFTIDTVAPQVTINGVTPGANYNTGKTITFAQNDANPGSLTGTLDGVAFASGTAVAAEGAHTLVVTATDLAGN
ncbi:MAG: Ig-like domain repeat protein, partial [Myxococcales bacterium]|nr:Ig-like domain repeat protein [Myxococcales bacterium]